MSAFDWKNQPSILGAQKWAQVGAEKKAPGPASHITFSTNVPHSINTESVKPADKTAALRRAPI